SNCDKFPVNYDKFPVRICLLWITLMFAIVPRETFGCWFFAAMPFCRSAGRSAGRSVLLLVYVCLMVFCLSAGLSAALVVCCVCLGLPGDSRQPSLCLPTPGVFLLVVTLLPAADLCRLHLLCCLFSVAQL
ncbi:hypothetical protein, partial [Thiolapillus sp.]|uniref:hypothetical protein n=1 Tax=Thiolapillus sp. TaxID=2017437 RepID=UPI003AF8B548